jgi:hypothetical protein
MKVRKPGQEIGFRRTDGSSDDFVGLEVVDEDAVEWLVLGVEASEMVPFADLGVVGIPSVLIAVALDEEGMLNRSDRK